MFLDPGQIQNLSTKQDQLDALEKNSERVKDKYQPRLADKHGERLAKLDVAVYIDLVLRCLFNKPWPTKREPHVKIPIDKLSKGKVKDLGLCWANTVDLKHIGLGGAATAGPLDEKMDPAQKEESNKEVDHQIRRQPQKGLNDCPSPDIGSEFQARDEVLVQRRISWCIPLST